MLVDTSVWVLWLRGLNGTATLALERLLKKGDAWMAPVILQELLQGARNPKDLEQLRAAFSGQPLLHATEATYLRAGEMYARCRWRGVTIRSPHDCLIATLAIENGVPLLQDDRDFEQIAGVEPALCLWRAPAN